MAINTTTDLNLVDTSQLVDESVTTDKLDGQAVTEAKLHSNAVTESKIANDAVTAAKIATGAVGATELASASVGTAKIDSGAATVNQFLSANGSGGASFASVEGTAIASTGATAGHVLTAGAGGTATTWSALPAGAGNLSVLSGTSTYSTSTQGTVACVTTSGTGYFEFITTGGGTVIVGNKSLDTTSSYTILRVSASGNAINAVATASFSVSAAGTNYIVLSGMGFNAGTVFLSSENSGTGGTVASAVIKKIEVGMGAGATLWTTTLLNAVPTTDGSYSSNGPFSYSAKGGRYASGPDIWYSGDIRNGAWGTGTPRIASVWVVNNTSGSAYSAPFGSAGTVSTQVASATAVVFVPSSTAATNGTIHAWGVVNSVPRYCTYSVTGTSITALATADGTAATGNNGAIAAYPAPLHALVNAVTWLTTKQKIVIETDSDLQIWDRGMTTMEHSSPKSADVFDQSYLDKGGFDEVTMRVTNAPTWRQLGNVDGMFAPMGSGFAMDSNLYNSYRHVLSGAGSATVIFGSSFIYGQASGSAFCYPMAGVAKVPFGGTSAKIREVTVTNSSLTNIIAVDAGGGFPLNQNAGTTITNGPLTFIAGTAQPYVYVRHAMGSSTPGTAISRNWILGGSAAVRGLEVSL